MLHVVSATGWNRTPVVKRIWKQKWGCGNPALLTVSEVNWQLERRNLKFSCCICFQTLCVELHLWQWQLHQCVLSGSLCCYSSIHLGCSGHGYWQALEQCHPVSSCCQRLVEKDVFSLTSAGMMISKCLQMKPLTQLRKPLQCELSAGRPGLWPRDSCSMSLRKYSGHSRAGTMLGV